MTTNTLTGEQKLSEAVALSIKGIKINIDKHLNCVLLCLRSLLLEAVKTYTFLLIIIWEENNVKLMMFERNGN
jgi:hypothetical protein